MRSTIIFEHYMYVLLYSRQSAAAAAVVPRETEVYLNVCVYI